MGPRPAAIPVVPLPLVQTRVPAPPASPVLRRNQRNAGRTSSAEPPLQATKSASPESTIADGEEPDNASSSEDNIYFHGTQQANATKDVEPATYTAAIKSPEASL